MSLVHICHILTLQQAYNPVLLTTRQEFIYLTHYHMDCIRRRLLGIGIALSNLENVERDVQHIYSTVKVIFTSLCVSGKNRHLMAPKLLASASVLQPLQPKVRNRIHTEQNAQESAWRRFDKLDFLHKSALSLRLPLTAGIRRACESSLPLTASPKIYHLNGFWYISAHRHH